MERKEIWARYADAWRTAIPEAEERIARVRQGEGRILVTDAEGHPVSDAHLTITQTNHAFRHGANIFMLDEMESDEKNALYRERFAAAFNMATLPFYWDTLEPTEGKPRYAKDSPKVYRRPAPDLCIEYCRAHGIEPREHALCYDHFFPAWLRGRSIAEVKALLERRMAEISERYAASIPTMEVTNEMAWWDGVSDFYHAADFMPWCFEMAERYFPHNKLGINEFGMFSNRMGKWSVYWLQIDKLLRMGRRIDLIGMQNHLFVPREKENDIAPHYYDPHHVWQVLCDYADLGPALEISEITFPAYSNAPEDEEFQATVVEHLYTLWFSHPRMEHAIYWNLVDGYAYGATQGDMTAGENYYHGGLLRFDLSPKPAYERLLYLFREHWHTAAKASSDAAGRASFRGFFGDYHVTVEKNGHTAEANVTLSKENGDIHIVL